MRVPMRGTGADYPVLVLKALYWGWSEGVASISFRIWSTSKWEEPLSKAKPFCISKRVVFEAYKRVKANQGAAGVDGESIADFEKDLESHVFG